MPQVRIPETSLFRELDGECVLVNVTTGSYFGLNETGTFVWRLLTEGVVPEAIPAALVEEYDTSLEEASADVAALLRDLRDQGLVEEGS